VGQATYENMGRAHCTLDTYGYKNILQLCNIYWFSTVTIVGQRRLNVTLYVHCLTFYALYLGGHKFLPDVHETLVFAEMCLNTGTLPFSQ